MSWLGDVYSNLKKKTEKDIIQPVEQKVSTGLGAAANDAKNWLSGVGSGVSGTANAVKNDVSDYFKNDATAGGIVKNTLNPVNLYSSAKKLVDNPLELGNSLEQFNYFKPTDKMRARDVVREIPGATLKTGEDMLSNTGRFIKQAGNTFGTGLDYWNPGGVMGKYKKSDVNLSDLPSVGKMLGSTAGSVLELAPFSKTGRELMAGGKLLNSAKPAVRIVAGAIPGYAYDVSSKVSQDGTKPKSFVPGLGTAFGAAFGYGGKPAAEDLDLAAKDIAKLPKSKRTTIIPGASETVSRDIFDRKPGQGTFSPNLSTGKMEKSSGFRYGRYEAPAGTKYNYPEQKIVEPWNPQSWTLKSLKETRPGLTIKDVSGETGNLDSKIAAKRAKARETVQNQINNQKNGSSVTEPVFVSPDGQESAKAAKNKLKTPEEMFQTGPYNQYQERAFNRKKNRIESIDRLMNYPTKLGEIGYKKNEIDRIGKNEADKILGLAELGYPKQQIGNIVKNFDQTDKILKNKVTWSQLQDYYKRKRALDTNFLEGMDPSELKDINPLNSGIRDVYRNFRATFGSKYYPEIKANLLDPFDRAKGQFVQDQRDILKELEDNIVNGLGIKKGSKLSEYVQKYGENQLLKPLEESDIPPAVKAQINLEGLKNMAKETGADWRDLAAKKLDELPNEKGQVVLSQLRQLEPQNWQKVVKADKWFRDKYNGLLDELNQVREANFPTHPLYPESSKIIPKRNDYYRHFQDMSGTLNGLKNLFETPSSIDPELAVQSEYTQPKSKWLSFAQRRNGDRTNYDAVGGFLDYLKSHAYAKNIDPFIQQFRGVDAEAKNLVPYENPRVGLAEELARKTDPVMQMADSQDPAGIKKILTNHGISEAQSEWMGKELSGMSDPEKVRNFLKNKLADNSGNPFEKMSPSAPAEKSQNKLNNFLKFLDNYANDLAGKTNPIDRPIQDLIGRSTLKKINWLNGRIKSNSIVGNLASSVAQFFNVPQGLADAGPKNTLTGIGDTLKSIFAKNDPMSKSSFIKERFFRDYNKFDTKALENTKNFAGWLTGVLDEAGTKLIWNSEYRKALSDGVADPIKFADDSTRRMVAGRGVGEVPIAQKAKMTQLIAPFQLEVQNLWHVFHDWKVEKKLIPKLIQYSVYAYLFNNVAQNLRGSRVAFDPLNAGIQAYQAYQNADNKGKGAEQAAGRMGGEVLSNIMGGQTFANIYPEYGLNVFGHKLPTRKEFFGSNDPTRFGTGGISDMISRGVQDPLFKILPSFGGSQIEKTLQGAGALAKGYATNNSGKVTTPVDNNWINDLRGTLFGKNALGEVQKYYNNNQTPLSANQSDIYKVGGGNSYYNSVMADRAANKEKAALKNGSKSTGQDQALPNGSYQLSNGDIYVKSLKKTFKTSDDANLAIAKDNFLKSDQKQMIYDGKVYQKTKNGNIGAPKTVDQYQSDINSADMTNAKDQKDVNAWLQAANNQYKLYQKMLVDPSLDELTKKKLQHSIATLKVQVAKYKGYGGFTKPKSSGSSSKSKIHPVSYYRNPKADPLMLDIQRLMAFGANPKNILVPMKSVSNVPLTRITTVKRSSPRVVSFKR